MTLIKFLRGSSQSISFDKTPYNDGYIYFTTDDGKFYIDADGKRTEINPDQINPDWNTNDPEDPSYIKNRPFYEQLNEKLLYNAEHANLYEETYFDQGVVLEDGKGYKIIINDTSYDTIGKKYSVQNGQVELVLIGNYSYADSMMGESFGEPDNGLPFMAFSVYLPGEQPFSTLISPYEEYSDVTLSLYLFDNEVVKVPERFLYKLDWNENDASKMEHIQNRTHYFEQANNLEFTRSRTVDEILEYKAISKFETSDNPDYAWSGYGSWWYNYLHFSDVFDKNIFENAAKWIADNDTAKARSAISGIKFDLYNSDNELINSNNLYISTVTINEDRHFNSIKYFFANSENKFVALGEYFPYTSNCENDLYCTKPGFYLSLRASAGEYIEGPGWCGNMAVESGQHIEVTIIGNGGKKYHPLDEQYIPNTIARKSDINSLEAVDEEVQNKISVLEEKVTDLENSNKPMDSYDDGQGNVTIVAPFAEISYDDGNVSIF